MAYLETADRRCTPQSRRSFVASAIEPITCCTCRVQAQPRKPVFVTPEISIPPLVRLNSTASKDKVRLTHRLKIATLCYAPSIGHDTIISHVEFICEAGFRGTRPNPMNDSCSSRSSIVRSAGVVDDQTECGVHLDQHLPCLSSTPPAPFALGRSRRVPNAGIDSFLLRTSPWKHRA
jgi:hypothetical protein